MTRKHTRGRYIPHNISKYNGDWRKIVYRSSWELKMFIECDTNDNILKWSSEEHVIPYYSEVDGKMRRYYMDVWLRMKTHDGKIVEKLIEIKPESQVRAPIKRKRKTQKYLREVETYIRNRNKWKAASKYAKMNGMSFHIFTEKHLGINRHFLL